MYDLGLALVHNCNLFMPIGTQKLQLRTQARPMTKHDFDSFFPCIMVLALLPKSKSKKHTSQYVVHLYNTIFFFACITGPSLPYALFYSAMAETPDERGVIVFGGWSDENDYEKRILELNAGANSWNVLDVTLKLGRKRHVVISLQ